MKFILLIISLYSGVLFAQYNVSGIVTDSRSKEPIAFVNVVINDNHSGTTTDIDGLFTASAHFLIAKLTFSCVGYAPLTVEVTNNEKLEIKLVKTVKELNEVVVHAGINPALRIIRNAAGNRNQNNPEKYNSYHCNTYSKFYYAMIPIEDSLKEGLNDSVSASLLKFMENHHLFLLETVSEKFYALPQKNHEIILATRVSGLKDPDFGLLGTDFQPLSFYESDIILYGTHFDNPIASENIGKYLYQLTDTVIQGKDTSFTIEFTSKPNTFFKALDGRITINTRGMAIENIEARPHAPGINDIRIRQKYELADSTHWFPVQLNVDLIFKGAGLVLVGRTYLYNSSVNNVEFQLPKGIVAVQLSDSAKHRSVDYWQHNRVLALSDIDTNTYHFIDSLGTDLHFDKKMDAMNALSTGSLPISIFNIQLSSLLNYNDFEGFRLGVGLYTNDKLSKHLSVGGYGAYGTTDKTLVYGTSISIYPFKTKEFVLESYYKDDVDEPGKTLYSNKQADFYRQLILGVKDHVKTFSGKIKIRLIKYATLSVSYSDETRDFGNRYYFEKDNILYSTSNKKVIHASLHYQFGERIMQSFNTYITVPSKYPVLELHYFNGNYSFDYPVYFNKWLISINDKFNLPGMLPTKLSAEFGYTQADIPYSDLFYARGGFADTYSFMTYNSFETIKPEEFLMNSYVAIFFSQTLFDFQFTNDRFRPELIFSNNVLFGSLQNAKHHINIAYKIPDMGFFESGIIINNLYRFRYMNMMYLGLGGGVYYRYGSYADIAPKNNLAVKIALSFSF